MVMDTMEPNCVQSTSSGQTTEGDGEVCLICHSSSGGELGTGTSPTSIVFDPLSPPALSADLNVYFLLRHVLELPSERLENYLRHCPKLGDWVKVCEDCGQNYVEKCKRIFMELLEVKRRFKDAKCELIGAIRRSMGEELSEVDDQEQYILDICKETRQFVGKHDYGNPVIKPLVLKARTATTLKSRPVAQKKRRGRPPVKSKDQPSKKSKSQKFDSSPIPYEGAVDCMNKDMKDSVGGTPFDESAFKEEPHSLPPFEESWLPIGGEYEDLTAESFMEKATTPCEDNISKSTKEDITKEQPNELPDPLVDLDAASQPRKTKSKGSRKAPKFKCKICNEAFIVRSKLRQHQISEHKTNYYECTTCDFKTSDAPQLKQHMNIAHGIQQDILELTCPDCQTVCSNKTTLRTHMSTSNGIEQKKNLQCRFCQKKFLNKYSYASHLGSIHGKKGYLKYHCTFKDCGKSFYYRSSLKRHETNHKPPQLKCDYCGKAFHWRTNLNTHVESVHENVMSRPYVCKLCPKSFKGKEVLQSHMKYVHDPNAKRKRKSQKKEPAPCPICGVVLADKYYIQSHIEYVHENKMLCCELCGKTLKSEVYMKLHMARVHGTGPVPEFTCTVEGCEKKFNRKSLMKKHITGVHQQVRPFQCEECGKSFPDKYHLKSHVEAMHTNRESKPFKCDLCGRGFAVKAYMNLHKRKNHKKETPPPDVE